MDERRQGLDKGFEKVAARGLLTDRFMHYAQLLNKLVYPSAEKLKKHFAGLFETQARVFYVESGQQAKLSRLSFGVADMVRRIARRLERREEYREFYRGYLEGVFRKETPEVEEGDLEGFFTDCVAVAAYFHDAGKDKVLYSLDTSPGFLDRLYKTAAIEAGLLAKIRQHVQAGARMINIKPVSDMVLHHHEDYDGEGYPQGLQRDRIPLGARIIFPCVALHAIVNWRSYDVEHPGWYGIEELKRCSGGDFHQGRMITHLQEEAYPKAMVALNKRLIVQEIITAHFRDEEKYFQERYLLDKPEQARRKLVKKEQFDPVVVKVLLEEFGAELRILK